jgi:FMN phosphatase YigB (HAD superfamily)
MNFTPALQAVLFDLDDTLWQPTPFFLRRISSDVLQLVFKRPLTAFRMLTILRTFRRVREMLRRFPLVPNLHRVQAQITAELSGVRPAEVLAIVRPLIYENVYAGSEFLIEPGARENLARLKAAGLKLGVLSDYPTQAKLAGTGLLEVGWDVMLSAEDVDSLKPNPPLFERGLEILGVRPECALYVGDRPDTDVDGAHALGLRTCLMRRRLRRSTRADLTVNSLAELTARLT